MTTPDVAGSATRAAALLERRDPTVEICYQPEQMATARRLWNAGVDPQPALIAQCRTTEAVQAAVVTAREVGMPLSVLGGGHDWAGRAVRDGALVIDLGSFSTIETDGAVAKVAGGVIGHDLLDFTRRHGRSAAVGTVGSVGVVGLTLGGGYGSLIGVTGLAVDNLIAAEVVSADGRVLNVDTHHEPDLFWALSGGGGNFGVVTHITTRLHPITDVTAGMIAFDWAQAREVLQGLREVHDTIDDHFDVMFGAMWTPAGLVLFTTPVWAGSSDSAAEHLGRVRALGDPVIDEVGRRPIADVVRTTAEGFPAGNRYDMDSRIVAGLNDAVIDAFIECVDAMPANCALNVHHSHGAAARVSVSATAHAYRGTHLVIEIIGWATGSGAGEGAWVNDTARRLDGVAMPGGWPNLMMPGDSRSRDAYGPNRGRLLQAKQRYDPDNIFQATALPSTTDEAPRPRLQPQGLRDSR